MADGIKDRSQAILQLCPESKTDIDFVLTQNCLLFIM